MIPVPRVSRRGRRRLRIAARVVGYAIVLVGVFILLLNTGSVSVRSVSFTYDDSEEVRDDTWKHEVERTVGVFFDETQLGVPMRTLSLFWHTPLEEYIEEHAHIKKAVISWEWFNVLKIRVETRKKFGVFCPGNRDMYTGSCSVLDTEGVLFAGGLKTSFDGLVRLVHQHSEDPRFLERSQFRVMYAVVTFLSKNNIETERVVASRHGAHSVILTLHTKDGGQWYINPHKPIHKTLFALKNGLKHVAVQNRSLSEIARFHIYDPLNIVYWWKKE